ncbi:MAG: GNAT family N-acetyltransferase [bacterium]
MSIEITIRDYHPKDALEVVKVFRDSNNTLRKSKGGKHPDDVMDKMMKMSDRRIITWITQGRVLLVAEVKETGEIAGIGTIDKVWRNRLLNSTCSANHYVKEKFQRGRAGVSVGSMLRRETINKAKSLGFRKMFGYSNPEAVGFHKRFGAKFFPAYNIKAYKNTVELNYYEFELYASIWNSIRIEPNIFKMIMLWNDIRRSLRCKLRI